MSKQTRTARRVYYNTKATANLPTSFEVVDYHEAYQILEIMQKIVPDIRIKEVGLIGEKSEYIRGNYVYMVYVGNLREPQNRAMLKALKLAL